MTAEELIALLQLEPLEMEGGFFQRTYYSDETLPQGALPERYQSAHTLGSSIYYLLTRENFSHFHSLLSDETYHFYMGDPVELVELHADGECTITILGPDLLAGQKLQHTVKKHTWQASYVRTGGTFALLGCSVYPSFEMSDFVQAHWETLLRSHPKHHQMIMRLTHK